MRKFLQLIDLAKSSEIFVPTHEKTGYVQGKATDLFWSSVENCRPFVFSPPIQRVEFSHGEHEVGTNHAEPIELQIDAPFQVFSIEVAGENFVAIDGELEADGKIARILCSMVVETTPKHYAIFSLVSSMVDGNETVAIIQTPTHRHLVSEYLLRLQREATGVEKVRQKIKIGTGATKRFHKILQIVHVRPRSKKEQSENASAEGIDWSHRFEVRGHWRKIEGIGKDREGLYCMDKYTWVKDFVKGREDLPLVRKTRLVKHL